MRKRKRRRRLATLTPYEDRSWVFAFCFYVDDGYSDVQADHLAWRDMYMEFPRLRGYEGCHA
jgi:hypothetical protein